MAGFNDFQASVIAIISQGINKRYDCDYVCSNYLCFNVSEHQPDDLFWEKLSALIWSFDIVADCCSSQVSASAVMWSKSKKIDWKIFLIKVLWEKFFHSFIELIASNVVCVWASLYGVAVWYQMPILGSIRSRLRLRGGGITVWSLNEISWVHHLFTRD